MILPPTYRHPYAPPRPERVYDIPRIVERRGLRRLAAGAFARWGAPPYPPSRAAYCSS